MKEEASGLEVQNQTMTEETKLEEEVPQPPPSSTNPTLQIGAFLAKSATPRSRMQLPNRQKSFKSSYSMEDAIQEAMAAQTLDDLGDEDAAGLDIEFPQIGESATFAAAPLDQSPNSDSLVSLMNPFQTRTRALTGGEEGIKSVASSDDDRTLRSMSPPVH